MLDLLDEAGGEYVDEESGYRIVLDRVPRWEYDPTALHRLVADGVLYEAEFAECLQTVVDKRTVQAWVDEGKVSQAALNRANARVGTKVVPTVRVEPVGTRAAGHG